MSRHVTWTRGLRRCGLVVATLGLAMAMGCGGHGLASADLFNPLAGRGRGAVDGFVFVPSRARQTLVGIAIPHANVQVFQLPRTDGDTPIGTGQADELGQYRIEGLPINVPMVVIAVDPFGLPGQPTRTVSGVVSFGEGELEKNKDLNEATSGAAAVVQQRLSQVPLSDAQIQALEQLAQDFISQALLADPTFDVTADADDLQQLANQLEAESFGSLLVRVFSTPASVPCQVLVNGLQVGTLVTAAPSLSRLEANELRVPDLVIGLIVVRLQAEGFHEVVRNVTILGGEEVVLQRTLVPKPLPGENQPPVIESLHTSPPFLPFQGGTTVIQADIGDPDGDPISATATVLQIGSGPASKQGAGTPFATVELTNVGGTFSGPVTVPGNPSIINQSYLVIVEASDGTDNPPTAGTVSFQVAGVSPPPPEPGDGGTIPGSIGGTVTDSIASQPLPAVTVTGGGVSTQTSSDGSYALTGVAPGSVTVLFSKAGFDTASAGATVVSGQQTLLNAQLTPSATSVVVRTPPSPPTLVAGRDQVYNFSGLLDTLGLTVLGPIATSGLQSNGVLMAAWDAGSQSYLQGPSVPEFETGVGYWVQSLSPSMQIFSGSDVPTDTPIPLIADWNLISIPFTSPVLLDDADVLVRVGGVTKDLFQAWQAGWVDPYAIGWEPGTQSYFVVADSTLGLDGGSDSILPGQAYWFWCNVSSAELLLSPTPAR